MLDTSNELLESIGHVALDSAPANWQRITITMSGMANSTTVRSEVSTPQGSQSLSLGTTGAPTLTSSEGSCTPMMRALGIAQP